MERWVKEACKSGMESGDALICKEMHPLFLLPFLFSTQELGVKKHIPVLFRSLQQIHENGELKKDGTLFM